MNRDYLEIELGSFPPNARNRSVKIKRTECSGTVTQKVRIGNRLGEQFISGIRGPEPAGPRIEFRSPVCGQRVRNVYRFLVFIYLHF